MSELSFADIVRLLGGDPTGMTTKVHTFPVNPDAIRASLTPENLKLAAQTQALLETGGDLDIGGGWTVHIEPPEAGR